MVNEWDDEAAKLAKPESSDVGKILDEELYNLEQSKRWEHVRPTDRKVNKNITIHEQFSGIKKRTLSDVMGNMIGFLLATILILFLIGAILTTLEWIGGLLR